jgi:signal transduction histidine kinase
MIPLYFVYGLAFFTLALAVGLEARRSSRLPLGRQLGWLAGFGITHALVEWVEMFRLLQPGAPAAGLLLAAHTLLLPLSALLLVRFGIGLIHEAGPLPNWLNLLPVVLIVPAALLITYGLIVALTQPPITLEADIWSRYLLYFPGCLLAAFGFVRQWLALQRVHLSWSHHLMLGAALGFVLIALFSGLVAPAGSQAPAAWLNTSTWQALTGVPVEVARLLAALVMTVFVFCALEVFEAERAQHLAELQVRRYQAHSAALAAQSAALEAQSAARSAAESWTSGLTEISRRIARLEDVDQVLAAIVSLTRGLLRADVATVALWNDDHSQLVVRCYSSAAGTVTGQPSIITSPVILQALAAGRPCRYPEDVPPPVPGWYCPTLQQPLPAAAIVPLLLEDRVIGGMWVGRVTAAPLSAGDLSGLEHLADQAVIAIQHSLMASQMQSVAVIEERSRIAREMHDGLAQILAYLSLELQRLEALAGKSSSTELVAALRQARQRVRAAQADVRENIASLRTTLAGEMGLLPALQQYLDEFGIQTGLAVNLSADLAGNPSLSPLAEVQLVRVIQEALTNVRKHAGARTVQVRLAECGGSFEVQVADDGCGFEPAASPAGHFGLQTMVERLQSVGGCLDIESRPGAGTRVHLSVPLV